MLLCSVRLLSQLVQALPKDPENSWSDLRWKSTLQNVSVAVGYRLAHTPQLTTSPADLLSQALVCSLGTAWLVLARGLCELRWVGGDTQGPFPSH